MEDMKEALENKQEESEKDIFSEEYEKGLNQSEKEVKECDKNNGEVENNEELEEHASASPASSKTTARVARQLAADQKRQAIVGRKGGGRKAVEGRKEERK